MAAEVKQKLFEPFYTTNQVGKGTGLGLSTVYGIVQQHSGHLEVVSEVGSGTLFRIFFPSLEKSSIKAP
jgi:two-component system, cell cycle sensor histidine kinase and response regulator CckA